MKIKILCFRIILFFGIQVITEPFFAQENNNIFMQQMEKVFQVLNTSEPFSMQIIYSEVDKNGDSEKTSSCYYYRKGKLGRYVFKEYDNLVNDEFYIKADHLKKEMIIIKKSSETKNAIEKDQALSQFNLQYFSKNGYRIDTNLSNLKKGLLVFESVENPYYNKVEIEYNTKNNYPLAYTLYFRPEVATDRKSFQIQFKNIQFGALDKNIFDERNFFTIKKGGKIEPVKQYGAYKILTL